MYISGSLVCFPDLCIDLAFKQWEDGGVFGNLLLHHPKLFAMLLEEKSEVQNMVQLNLHESVSSKSKNE